jgi:hypothetical protein
MIRVVHPGSLIQILIFYLSRIRIRNTAFYPFFIDNEYAQDDTYLTLSNEYVLNKNNTMCAYIGGGGGGPGVAGYGGKMH